MSYDGKALKSGSSTLASQVDASSSQGEPGKRTLTEALSPQTIAEATPAPAVLMRSGDARHDSHAFSAASGEPRLTTPRPALEALFGTREQTINDGPALQREPQTESVAPAHEEGTAEASASAQSKPDNAPIQRNKSPGKTQKKSYVPYQVTVAHVMTQDEFKTAAMTQVFGGPLTGLVWQSLRDQYTPDQSPYVLQVEVSLLKQLRGNVNRTRGIDTDDQGNVSGASERWAEFDASAASGDRSAVYAEIDRRYYAAAGTNQKIERGDEGKAALWRSIRDEVLFERAYLGNLPPQVAALIKVGIKGRPLTPADYDRLFRIAKRIEGMPPGLASDYASKITASTDDLATFEAALNAYATEMTARGKQDEERQAVQLKLAGLEGLYQTYRGWKEAVAADARAAAAAQGAPQAGVGPVMVPSLSAGIADQLDAQLKANGFASVGEFVGFIDKFTASFEQGAAIVAEDYLDRYSGYLYRQQERYSDPGEAAALYQAFAPFRGDYDDFQNNAAIANKWVAQKQNDVPGNWQQTYAPDAISDDVGQAAYRRASQAKAAAQADLGTLAQQHPIFNEDGLPEDKHIDKVKLATASQDQLGTVVQAQIARRAGDIAEARGELAGKPSTIYKMTKLFPQFYAQMGISPGSIYDMIIQDELHEDAIDKLVGGILLAIVGIALAVISGGTATPAVVAVGAGIAGAGLSAYMVYDQYEEYVQEKHLAGAGLADDPSVAWLVVAIVGAGLDMGAAAKAVSKLGAAAKALDAGGELADFSKAVEALQQAGEIDARIAAATERAAAARKAFSAASEDLSRALAKAYSLPGPFTDPEVYKALVKMAMGKIRQGMAQASIWIDELRAARAAAKLGEMAPDELAAAKKAWEEAAKREGRRPALESERGVTKLGTVSEADSILQAETEGKVVGEARRTDPALGEPDLDFRMVDPASNKPLGYVDIKTPVTASTSPIPEQAFNIAKKIKRYDPDVEVIVDLKNLGPDKANFVAELAKNGVVEGGMIKLLNK
jgi:hypothetical protein